jgi:DNA-binding NarL/FixJ family response regulator
MKKIRLFIVEDHPIFREALISLLRQNEGLDIVDFEGDALQAVKRINDLRPDVVITDLSMPRLRGQQLIETIKKRNPDIKTIVLTMHKSEEHVRSSLDAGADAYVLKDDTHQDLVIAIQSVIKGNSYLSPGICATIVHGYLDDANRHQAVNSDREVLTKRERQIIKLIAEGESNSAIATLLSISRKTVEKHRSNIMKKLDLHNAANLTKYAIENNYL